MCRPGFSSSREGGPGGLPQRPLPSPALLDPAGEGETLLRSADKSELFHVQPGPGPCARQQPASHCQPCAHRSSEAPPAAVLRERGTDLLLRGKMWEGESARQGVAAPWGGGAGSCSDPGLQVARVCGSLPASICLPSLCLASMKKEPVCGLFSLLVQYAFSRVRERSFRKPWRGLRLLRECMDGEARPEAVKLASAEVSSAAPPSPPKDKSYLGKSEKGTSIGQERKLSHVRNQFNDT